MKRFILFSLVVSMFTTVAMADMYRESVDTCDEAEMRAALDRATSEHRAVVTIVRYGHPIAQIVPCRRKRCLDIDPKLSQIQIKGSLFDDDSSDWEAMND